MYAIEMEKLMHKFNQNQLPIVFKNLFRPNTAVYSQSTRNSSAYHLPFYSTSVSNNPFSQCWTLGTLKVPSVPVLA